MAEPINTTDAAFQQEVMQSDVPVLVDFWATWCGPCRAVAPALKQIAAEYEGQIKVVKLDIDANPQTPGQLGVMSIPTMLIVKDGEIVDRWVGAKPKEAMVQRIEPYFVPVAVATPEPVANGTVEAAAKTPVVHTEPINVDDAGFDSEVLDSSEPVLVDFWATWCGPCRQIAPAVKEIAAEHGGKLKVVKVDVDQNPTIVGRYGVMSMPTLMVFKNGQVVDRWVGAQPKEAMLARIEPLLN